MMRLGMILALLVLALASGADAQTMPPGGLCPGMVSVLSPLGFQQQTVSTNALALPSIPVSAKMAVVTIEANPVRYRDDGTAPTASIGVFLNGTASVTTTVIVCGPALGKYQHIRQGGSDAVADISYYGY